MRWTHSKRRSGPCDFGYHGTGLLSALFAQDSHRSCAFQRECTGLCAQRCLLLRLRPLKLCYKCTRRFHFCSSCTTTCFRLLEGRFSAISLITEARCIRAYLSLVHLYPACWIRQAKPPSRDKRRRATARPCSCAQTPTHSATPRPSLLPIAKYATNP